MLVYADIRPKELNVNQFSGIRTTLLRYIVRVMAVAKIIMFCFNCKIKRYLPVRGCLILILLQLDYRVM